MASNPVGWFEIYVQDMDRAKRFYEAVFNVQLQKLETPKTLGGPGMELWAFPMVQDRWGASGALVRMPGFTPGGGGGVLVYFSCGDCAVEAGRVVAAGGKIQREKMPIGQYGFIALAFDTEGNMIGLHSMS